MPTNPAPDDPPAPRKKFKYTQQLVKIALDELTQEELARLCRVSQSVVSGWLHGRSRAYEHQLTEVRKRYGHRLHRATFRVYLVAPAPQPGSVALCSELDWEPYRITTRTRALDPEELTLDLDLEDAPAPGGSLPTTVTCTERHWAPEYLRVVQVEGPVALRHLLTTPGVHASQPGQPGRPSRLPAGRWVVHYVGPERFVVVRQRRRRHHGPEADLWAALKDSKGRGPERHPPVEAGDDAARWLSHVGSPCDALQLLRLADDAARTEGGLLGAALLPFLVRKMLMELGYSVEGVERIGPAE